MIARQRDEADAERQRANANFQLARNAVDQMLTRVADERLANYPQTDALQRELLEQALQFYQGLSRAAS